MNNKLKGRKTDLQGSSAAHSWKETAVRTPLKHLSVAHS
jgi:hypothetical protein